MLEIQKYLIGGKTLDDLTAELGIKTTHHPTLPLVILNYCQIESPKTNPLVREARALVLDKRDWSVAARSFSRFFNWGEVQDEQHTFDFSDFVVQSKEDGSLVVLYYFDGEWHANTRGSFAVDNMQFQNFTWREAFCKGLGISGLSELKGKLDETVCYICEFCSPWNKIVRRYDQPHMYLLTAFKGIQELSPSEVDGLAGDLFKRPTLYNFCSIEETQAFLQEQAAGDATFEGVVIRDRHGNRFKIKSATYLGLHKLRGEGDNVWNPKHLLPFILSGEEDELLTYFEEVRDTFYELKCQVQKLYIGVLENWVEYHQIELQKDFALAVKDKPLASILFQVRKQHGGIKDIKEIWKNSAHLILKSLKS